MDDRLAKLECRVTELTEAVARLERRVEELQEVPLLPVRKAATGPTPAPAAGTSAADASEEGAVSILSLCGRSFVVLGGAYLVRAITDTGSLPRLAGVVLGLAYALVWVGLADRAGRSGQTLSATFHGFVALMIGYPLVWEATTRLGVLSPPVSACLLAVFTAALATVAWRRDLHELIWGVTLASLAATLGLFLATRSAEPFTALLVAFGAASLWLTYGRRWHGLRWPAALAADLAVLATTTLAATRGGPPEAWKGLSAGWAAALALSLFVVYPGSIAARTLVRQRAVNVFEVVQTAIALLVGFGGAVRVAQAAGIGEAALGTASLLLGAGGYAVAFAFIEHRSDGWNFLFFTSLALVLVLIGSTLLSASSALSLFWAGLAVAAAAFGSRLSRLSLESHGAVYLWAAALQGGLLGAATDAFLGKAGTSWRPFSPAVFAVLAAAGASIVFLAVWRRRDGLPASARLPGLAMELLAVFGAGGAVVVACVSLVRATADPGVIAAVRTAVVAGGAVVLALARARLPLSELGWIAGPLLAVGAMKLLFEDLPVGRPATLFPAFALYGVALLWVPGILRRSRKAAREPDSPGAPAAPGH